MATAAWPKTLAFRIYLVGLAQFAVVVGTIFVLVRATRPPGGGPLEGDARFIASTLETELGRRAGVDGVLTQARRDLRTEVRLVDPDGALVASSARDASPRCTPGSGLVEKGGEVCIATDVAFPDGRRGHLESVSHWRPPGLGLPELAFVLFVVGVSSWLLARSLTRPLGRLSTAAREFGSGELRARAALDRADELGDVSRTFDEMADRVTALLRAERELLANVSHELRTPLARIRVALDLAAEGDASVARESISDISADLDELERLIADVLTAARLELSEGTSGGIPPLKMQRVEASSLLEHAATRFRAAHPSRRLLCDVSAALPQLEADPVLLRRVIDNLLENAHKYTELASATIELAVRLDGDLVVFEVRDHGFGISPDDLSRVFRPFFRADKSRTRATGGLGLGLALAKRIVEAHGGKISLTSRLNEGTVATVKLPASLTANKS